MDCARILKDLFTKYIYLSCMVTSAFGFEVKWFRSVSCEMLRCCLHRLRFPGPEGHPESGVQPDHPRRQRRRRLECDG